MSDYIRDDGDLRKWRTELPNMADDDLDPYQYRLYGHYKRVCGANGGECYESVRTTAEKTKMSNEKVIATRQWLADNEWIAIKQRAKGTFNITIIDRWEDNFERYFSKNTVRNSEQSTRKNVQANDVPLEIPNNTVRNSEHPPLEISNQRSNHIKKEQNKEEPPLLQTGGGGGEDRNRQSDKEYAEVCTAVESNGFGMLTPFTADEIKTMMDDYPKDWILDAMKIAVSQNKRKLSYAAGVLRRWRADGRDEPKKESDPKRVASWQGFNQDLPEYMKEMMQ